MRKPYQAVRRYPRNITGRDFVVGDVHGCFSRLDTRLAELGYDPINDRLFSVGDLIDRGPESAAVLEAVRRHRIKAILGNHEDMLVRWCFEDAHGAETVMMNGGGWFMDLADGSGRARPIARFMASLPYAIEIDTVHGPVGLLHADAPRENGVNWSPCSSAKIAVASLAGRCCGSALDGSSLASARVSRCRRGLRRSFGRTATHSTAPLTDPHRCIQGIAAVIVWHTPVPEPTVRGNVINIDTGAVYRGALTILSLSALPEWLTRGANQGKTGCPGAFRADA
ncbi:metallophosphoesterase [Paraburkholderia jirisanensis]